MKYNSYVDLVGMCVCVVSVYLVEIPFRLHLNVNDFDAGIYDGHLFISTSMFATYKTTELSQYTYKCRIKCELAIRHA